MKRELVSMAKDWLPVLVGDRYTDIVLACLCCLDVVGDNIFSDVKDNDNIVIGVRFIENDPIPEGICVFTTLDEAAKIEKASPSAISYPENNGYYAKDPDGTVIAVASDEMCEVIDCRNAELEAKIAAGWKRRLPRARS
ncbi:hypothetical protein ETB97_012160 [Aspergillus alliaceus]|uniref:Uncharacterized protein n=1 Tax=Petromyces alliaceus TaxID=209559 RepID=A0A8H6E8P5_PETAA|nr:hypothetical protein ETB97_012160 [Aspergillus burnettii]